MMPQSNLNTMMILAVFLFVATATAFQPTTTNMAARTSPLFSTAEEKETSKKQESGYVPKWVKKKTLADEMGDLDFKDKGIKGTISVVFRQGDESKTTMAMPGQPLRDVATQAGQFIKYGCGKGECGTCECMMNGKWVRPCRDVVPAGNVEGDIVITVKEVSKKSKSSGKFFSVKSFFMGFYNNVLGMVGFVKYRQNAAQNWEERQEYEERIRQLTLEKRAKRQEEWRQRKAAAKEEYDGLSP